MLIAHAAQRSVRPRSPKYSSTTKRVWVRLNAEQRTEVLARADESAAELAAEYGVSEGAIRNIWRAGR